MKEIYLLTPDRLVKGELLEDLEPEKQNFNLRITGGSLPAGTHDLRDLLREYDPETDEVKPFRRTLELKQGQEVVVFTHHKTGITASLKGVEIQNNEPIFDLEPTKIPMEKRITIEVENIFELYDRKKHILGGSLS